MTLDDYETNSVWEDPSGVRWRVIGVHTAPSVILDCMTMHGRSTRPSRFVPAVGSPILEAMRKVDQS